MLEVLQAVLILYAIGAVYTALVLQDHYRPVIVDILAVHSVRSVADVALVAAGLVVGVLGGLAVFVWAVLLWPTALLALTWAKADREREAEARDSLVFQRLVREIRADRRLRRLRIRPRRRDGHDRGTRFLVVRR